MNKSSNLLNKSSELSQRKLPNSLVSPDVLNDPIRCSEHIRSLESLIDWLYANGMSEYESIFRRLGLDEYILAYDLEPMDIINLLKIRNPNHINKLIQHKYQLLYHNKSKLNINKYNKQQKKLSRRQQMLADIANKQQQQQRNDSTEENKYNTTNTTSQTEAKTESKQALDQQLSSNPSRRSSLSVMDDVLSLAEAEALIHARSYGHLHPVHALPHHINETRHPSHTAHPGDCGIVDHNPHIIYEHANLINPHIIALQQSDETEC